MYTLVIDVPSGDGYIYVSPGSSNGRYASGTIVTLTAMADADHGLQYWAGDVFGTDTTITILMDSDKSVAAYFILM
jgi:hypothetical protein